MRARTHSNRLEQTRTDSNTQRVHTQRATHGCEHDLSAQIIDDSHRFELRPALQQELDDGEIAPFDSGQKWRHPVALVGKKRRAREQRRDWWAVGGWADAGKLPMTAFGRAAGASS
jgi:hypothetical protein